MDLSEPPAKRQKWSIQEFGQEEADEADDYEDEEAYDEDDDEGDWRAAKEDAEKVIDSRRQNEARWRENMNANDDVDAQLRYIQQKYKGSDADSVAYSAQQSAVEQVPGNLLPTVKDPKLWTLKTYGDDVTPRGICLQIMHKYLKYKDHPSKKLFIKAAFTRDDGTNLIYVEAEQEIHIRRALDGIPGVSTWGVKLVPIREMISAVTVQTTGPRIKKNQWVRLKRGIHKDDLGQVFKINDTRLIIRLLPRIDWAEISAREGGRRRKRIARPPARLFSQADIEELGGEVEDSQRIDPDMGVAVQVFNRQKFYKGFRLWSCRVEVLVLDPIVSQEEVNNFTNKLAIGNAENADSDDEEMQVAKATIRTNIDFKRQDVVKVVKGPFKGLIGKVRTSVKELDGKVTVTIQPNNLDSAVRLDEAISFNAEELKKFFTRGVHVNVIRGKYKGESGLVVQVIQATSEVTIYTRLTCRSLTVKEADIVEGDYIAPKSESGPGLHDLISLNNGTIGVIVQKQVGQYTILDYRGQTQLCTRKDIEKIVKDFRNVAFDMAGQEIKLDDMVIPQLGPFNQTQVLVKHLHQTILFCHTRQCLNNSGVFVINARSVKLAGTRTRKPVHATKPLKFNSARDDKYVEKTVKITKGPWKSYLGIVKSATDKCLRIELHAKNKIIQVKRNMVKQVTKDGHDPGGDRNMSSRQRRSQRRRRLASGAETPLIGAQTPHYQASATPHHHGMIDGSQTPHYSSQTPRHVSSDEHGWSSSPRSTISQDSNLPYEPAYGSDSPHSVVHTPTNSAYGGPTTPTFNPEDTGLDQEMPQSIHNQNSIFTPTTPSTPQMSLGEGIQPYDPQDVSSSNEEPSTTDFEGGYGSMSGTGLTAPETEAGGDGPANPYYYIVPNAVLKHDESNVKVVSSSAEQAEVQVLDSDNQIIETKTLDKTALKVYPPPENSKIQVVLGRLAGDTGELIGIDGEDAIVKMDVTFEIQILPHKSLVLTMQ